MGIHKSIQKVQAMSESNQLTEETINQLARKYRHIGFAIFGGLALLLSIFLAYSAITSIQNGEIYDPFTGAKVVTE